MNRALKVVEFAWIIMGIICLIEFIRLWDTGGQTFYIFGAGIVVAAFMFWLRRSQRLKYQKRQQQKQEEQQQ